MLDWFLQLRIDQAWLLWLAIAITVMGAAFLATVPFRRTRRAAHSAASTVRADVPKRDRTRVRRRFWLGFIGVGLAATLVFWYLIDVANVFGIPVGFASRVAWSLGWAVTGGAITAAVAPGKSAGRGLRRSVAIATIPLAVMTTALVINDDAGVIHELADLIPDRPLPQVVAVPTLESGRLPIQESEWQSPADMPAEGRLETATIPPTVSGFTAARDATVYLPPAALVAAPPVLPVMIMLSGQPGTTADLYVAGEFQNILDSFAQAHHGLAPIVVTADQLGNPDQNPLCADGGLGNVRTYLQQDVVNWVTQTFNVATDRTAWTFGGFSNGATCTFQVGLDLPERFGNDLAISPEVNPGSETPTESLNEVFGGDQSKMTAASPLAVMQRHAPYSDTDLFVGVGGNDSWYIPNVNTLLSAAQDAGITINELVSPDTGHDFHTVKWVLEQALPPIMVKTGMITKDASG